MLLHKASFFTPILDEKHLDPPRHYAKVSHRDMESDLNPSFPTYFLDRPAQEKASHLTHRFIITATAIDQGSLVQGGMLSKDEAIALQGGPPQKSSHLGPLQERKLHPSQTSRQSIESSWATGLPPEPRPFNTRPAQVHNSSKSGLMDEFNESKI